MAHAGPEEQAMFLPRIRRRQIPLPAMGLSREEEHRSRDIVFMEEKTIADWEMEKKQTSSESTDRDRLDETRIHPVGRRMLAKEQTTGRIRARNRIDQRRTGHEPESDSDEELTEGEV